ncbi:ABC transporter efflux protein, DrrB family [Actinacidiphila yanglinensis]|uniref:Transport permease protein n=1 Tax=Actinacidiphila yanglinensis TaxID=310779 RepID=A0A1H6E9G9_9ACTN|nr:ABC transporter permease [Actinacidiphila yanglinensis]SEG93586.1 ABC transporter efflux protein, DrrB family [Actinacidiphila yanglinensis]
MTTYAAAPGLDNAPGSLHRISQMVSDTVVLTRRNLVRTLSEPESLIDVTLTPVVFTLLFAYVVGGAIALPNGVSYHDYLVPGMFAMTMASASTGTAAAVNTDMANGIIDRFRSLPMSRAGVLAGQSIADLLTTIIAVVVLAATGLAIGWRVHTDFGHAAAAFGLILLFAYALNWAMSCLGMVFRSAEGVQQFGVLMMLGLTFVSSAFVPTSGMPAWLRNVANWNPLSALAAALRQLFGNPNPAHTVDAWPLQHPVVATICYSVGMIVIFAPLAVRLYRTRTSK